MWSQAGALVMSLAVGQGVPHDATEINPAIRGLLTRELKFSPAELSDIEHGKVARHTLGADTAGEVAAVGVIWVDAPTATFLREFSDIARFKQSEGVLQIGRFSNEPTIEDLARLSVDENDFDARRCRVGNCSVRLSASEIARFQREIAWDAPDAKARAAGLYKQVLLDHVRAYWFGGPARMKQYDAGTRAIRPVDEFVGILNNSSAIGALAPGLPEHLRDFPAGRLEGAEDFLYWSKERFGMAPFITVTHVTMTRGLSGSVVITSKDVYSSRYMDASLGTTVISEAPGGGFHLIYLNRSRADALKGGLSGLRRAIVERRARGSLEQNLKAIKTRLERRR
jgi:hypothetical protein